MSNLGKRLDEYMSRWENFSWSDANCCHFCAGWLVQCGLQNPMETLTEAVTERSAYRIIQSLGGFEPTVSHFLGRSAVGMSQLKIGDLILRAHENGRGSLGIVTGRHAAYCAESGVEYLEIQRSQRGWRIQK